MLVLASWLFCLSYSSAQTTEFTNNILTGTWSGATVGNINPGGTSGGNTAAYNPTTNTILFGYVQQTVQQTIALDKVFNGTGIRVYGYEFSMQYQNSGFSKGNLGIAITAKDAAGFALQTDSHTIDKGGVPGEWSYYSALRPYTSPYGTDRMQSINISITGKDDRYWAGYYGPQVRDPSLKLQYVGDECKINPLYSTSCPGYEQAYITTQCNINSLYSPSCTGYAQAYLTQQCNLNPLYNPSCTGYAQALFTKTCAENPLSNPSCTGYAQAYFTQQCQINPLYDKSCTGYESALFTKTCAENPLSNTRCPLYESAYLNQQCNINQLFSTSCPLYQQTYFNQQCGLNPLYNQQCVGYAEAYKSKLFADSCKANPQTNSQCPGYTIPTVSSNIESNKLTTTNVENQLVPDPITNTVLTTTVSKADGTSPVNVINPQPALGQGLQLPGTMPTTSSSTRTTQATSRAAAVQQALQQTKQLTAEQKREETAIASIATVPGFDAYQQVIIPDARFYIQEQIYKRATLPDNQRAQRALSQRSDKLHGEMIDEQYRK